MLGSREAIVVDSEHEYVAVALGYDGNDKDKVHSRRPYPSRCDWLVSTRRSQKVKVKRSSGVMPRRAVLANLNLERRRRAGDRDSAAAASCASRSTEKTQTSCAHEHSHFRRSRTEKPHCWQIQLVHDVRH